MWRKKYGFVGCLDVDKLESMIKQMHVTCGDKIKKQQTDGLDTARVWLLEARKRVEGNRKQASERKKERETIPTAPIESPPRGGGKIYPALTEQAWVEDPDNEVVIVGRRRAPPPYEGPGEDREEEGFRRDMEGLTGGFKLNTGELERSVRQIVGKDWTAVRGDWTTGQGDRVVLQWAADGDYQGKLYQLCNNHRDHYDRHADFSNIQECRQGDSETVSQYLERLRDVFNGNSGLIQPGPGIGGDGPYHQQLKIAFLSGMRPEICQSIKKTLVGWGTATLAEVKRYAVHHEQNGREKKSKRDLKGAEYLIDTLGEIVGQNHGKIKPG